MGFIWISIPISSTSTRSFPEDLITSCYYKLLSVALSSHSERFFFIWYFNLSSLHTFAPKQKRRGPQRVGHRTWIVQRDSWGRFHRRQRRNRRHGGAQRYSILEMYIVSLGSASLPMSSLSSLPPAESSSRISSADSCMMSNPLRLVPFGGEFFLNSVFRHGVPLVSYMAWCDTFLRSQKLIFPP